MYDKEKAYIAGREDRIFGKSLLLNPYEFGSTLWELYRKGWHDCHAELEMKQ